MLRAIDIENARKPLGGKVASYTEVRICLSPLINYRLRLFPWSKTKARKEEMLNSPERSTALEDRPPDAWASVGHLNAPHGKSYPGQSKGFWPTLGRWAWGATQGNLEGCPGCMWPSAKMSAESLSKQTKLHSKSWISSTFSTSPFWEYPPRICQQPQSNSTWHVS